MFCYFDGALLPDILFFYAILNKVFDILGLGSKSYRSHSFRIGAASVASRRELKSPDWESRAIKDYIRIPSYLLAGKQ